MLHILFKLLTAEPRNILCYKRARLHLQNYSDEMRKHVADIVGSILPPCGREWLTWGAAVNYVYKPSERGPTCGYDIAVCS